MKKQILLLAMMLLPIVAGAEPVVIDGIYYNLDSSTDEAEVTNRVGGVPPYYFAYGYDPGDGSYSGSVTIPTSVTYDGKEYRVTSIGKMAFYKCSDLTSVKIPNSVTSIKEAQSFDDDPPFDHYYHYIYCGAFEGCSGLSSVTIPNSVTNIGSSAFRDCTNLTSITISNNVTSIKGATFAGCTSLKSVSIPSSVTRIEESTIVEYTIDHDSGSSSSCGAFEGCSSLTSVTIPNSVTSIGRKAFSGCSGLTSVTIPNGVTSIGGAAFSDCSGLTSVTIPGSVTSIGINAFTRCSGLTSITIPGSVTSIGGAAFSECSGLTSVTIPYGVTSIEQYAFASCTGLTAVTIPSSVTSIGVWAFSYCSGLTSVTIPNNVTSIEGCAFYGCSGLTAVTIPNSVTSIRARAFYDCSSLTSVTIGSGVKNIYDLAFASCKELKDVYCLAEKVPAMTDYSGNGVTNAFQNSYIEYATLHVPIASIGAYRAKEPWKSFKSIVGLDGTPKCATPTIAFVDGELTFSCETEDVEYTYEVSYPATQKGNGSKIAVATTCRVTVYATKAGYDNSDTATLEFSLGAGGDVCDVNGDGAVNVADIATIIDEMAARTRLKIED